MSQRARQPEAHRGPEGDRLAQVFGALADPTRRRVLDTILDQGSTSVPALTATLPITRQAVAKHVSALQAAGLIEREPVTRGREVRYRLADDGLTAAANWMASADTAWTARLERLRS